MGGGRGALIHKRFAGFSEFHPHGHLSNSCLVCFSELDFEWHLVVSCRIRINMDTDYSVEYHRYTCEPSNVYLGLKIQDTTDDTIYTDTTLVSHTPHYTLYTILLHI